MVIVTFKKAMQLITRSEEQIKVSLLFYFFKRTENIWFHENLYTDFYSGIIYNHQELKTNEMPSNCFIKNLNVLQLSLSNYRNLPEEDQLP